MRDTFTVAGLSLMKTRKEKLFLLIMIGLALLFTSAMGIVFHRQENQPEIPVGIADLNKSALSAAMIDFLESEAIYRVDMMSEQQLYDEVREGKIEVGFVIPEGFEESLSGDTPDKVSVVRLATSNTAMVIGRVLERKVTEYLLGEAVKGIALEQAAVLSLVGTIDADALAGRVKEQYSQNPALTVDFAAVTKTEEDSEAAGDQGSFAIGVYLMFTMFTVVFSAGDILQERRDGTWARLMATPASRASILAGKMLGAYAVGAVQISVLLLFGRYVQKLDYGSGPLGLAVVMAIFLLAVTGMGIMLSTMVRTLAQLQTLSPIVIVSTCMLGGCYWPLDVVSPLMQTIAKFTPQAWAMTAATDIVARGLSLYETSPNLLALLGFAAVFFVIGVSRVKYE